MSFSPTELGALVDRWVAADNASVVETDKALTVSRIGALQAAQLHHGAVRDWTVEIADGAMELSDVEHLNDDMGPYIVTIYKGEEQGGVRRIFTLAGLAQALANAHENEVWQIAAADVTFTSGLVSFNPWGRGDIFAPATKTKSPLDLVRESAEARLVPSDIRKWLLRSPIGEDTWRDKAFQVFVREAAPALIRSLATEVVGKAAVVFAGPPRLSLQLDSANVYARLEREGFNHAQSAAAWVYEDAPSAEQRHALFAAEFARSVARDELVADAFKKLGGEILEGARLSYQLSLSELSREAIKAQADLRKSIADDMAKAAESTRTLVAAIAVSIATGIGLVAARAANTADVGVLSLVAGVVGLYVVAVTLSGWWHLWVQRKMRDQWRRRFYSFIPSDDYEAAAINPSRDAERPYHLMAVIGVVVSAGLMWMAWTGFGQFKTTGSLKSPSNVEQKSHQP